MGRAGDDAEQESDVGAPPACGGERRMGSAVGDVDDIDFDDLTSPRLTDVQRQILEFTEAKRVEFDVDQMLAEAIEQASVGDDLDDTDGFSDRLAAHVAAIEADHGLTQLTRSSLRQRVVRLLRNRLSLTDLLKRYPEIESIRIEKPFIVVGMPRSGTTHLVNLVAADPRRRALPYWESQDPIPALGQPFDPNLHEAIMQQPHADYPEGTVVAELAKGYKLGDRVIRPSKVAVSVRPAE